MQVGDIVHILSPFDEAFPFQYQVASCGVADDGQAIIFLVDVFGAFDPKFLQVI
jgi:hypothetical protein